MEVSSSFLSLLFAGIQAKSHIVNRFIYIYIFKDQLLGEEKKKNKERLGQKRKEKKTCCLRRLRITLLIERFVLEIQNIEKL